MPPSIACAGKWSSALSKDGDAAGPARVGPVGHQACRTATSSRTRAFTRYLLIADIGVSGHQLREHRLGYTGTDREVLSCGPRGRGELPPGAENCACTAPARADVRQWRPQLYSTSSAFFRSQQLSRHVSGKPPHPPLVLIANAPHKISCHGDASGAMGDARSIWVRRGSDGPHPGLDARAGEAALCGTVSPRLSLPGVDPTGSF